MHRHVTTVLEALKTEHASTSLDALCDALKRAYPMYNRKKQMFLRKAVESIRGSWLNAQQPGSQQGGEGSKRVGTSTIGGGGMGDGEDEGEEEEGTTHKASSMNASLYQQHPPPPAPTAALVSALPKSDTPVASGGKPPKRKRGGVGDGGAAHGAHPSLQPTWELPAYVASTVRYSDVGGLDSLIRILRDTVEYPLACPGVYAHLCVEPPRGVLLIGAPGCGKTLLAQALAGELHERGVYVRSVSGPELIGGLSGESEGRLRAVFDDVVTHAGTHGGGLLFIDEVDVIAPRRDSTQRGMELRMVSQLMTCMDSLTLQRTGGVPVLVVAASNKPENIDSGLRRTGRFDREVTLPIPDEGTRETILKVLAAKANVEAGVDWRAIARATPGFVGADLAALIKEGAALAIERVLGEAGGGGGRLLLQPPTPSALSSLFLTMGDFMTATTRVQPSALREGFATVPNVSWEDVGALAEVRGELSMAILQPLRRPEAFRALGLTVPAGVLLYGPPGCGKTLLAKAIAAESSANFISVKGPELLDKYVGESERAVRSLFQRARASSPCIIFFDELDALAPRRGGGSDGGGGSSGSGSNVTERVVNQLLTEMDGLESRRDVFVVAATNRPDIIDPAMLRPGRLDKLLFVPLPTPKDRAAILRTQARRMPLGGDVDFDTLASHPKAARFSGADLAALVREAAVGVLKRYFQGQGVDLGDSLRESRASGSTASDGHASIESPPPPCMQDFLDAFERVQASVSQEDEHMYGELRRKLRGSQ
jgi:ribosome biogenesis ATPase